MDTIWTSGRVTSSTGNVDPNGDDIVGELAARIDVATRGPLEGRYVEREGLDDRITEAGADVATLRRLLRVAA